MFLLPLASFVGDFGYVLRRLQVKFVSKATRIYGRYRNAAGRLPMIIASAGLISRQGSYVSSSG